MAERRRNNWIGASLRAAPDVRSQEFDGEVVLVDLRGGEYYGLDGVGALVWELLQGAVTLEEMVTAVTSRYEVDEETCRADIAELLDNLLGTQLIELVPAAS